MNSAKTKRDGGPVFQHPFRASFLGLSSLALTAYFLVAQTNTAPSTPVIGSQNAVTADPPVSRPHTTPCKVQLFSNYRFADFSGKPFQFAPPVACPGPWQKVVLEADFSIDSGRQFDRSANIWIGGTAIYFGTTAEPSQTVARSWHVESDLTDYSSLFTAPQSGQIILNNLVNDTYTSVLTGSGDLLFYPVEPHKGAPTTADLVLPLSAGPNGGTVTLTPNSNELSKSLSLPRNIERVYLDVYSQGQGPNDELWYTCVPDNLSGELQSCTGTGFRETEISIDGQPAGVAPIYPWIFTGGIDPLLWRPTPGVETLNFTPYRVDLTPFAGVLSNGQPHQIALSVYNNSNSFQSTASLLLYLDHNSDQVTGEVTTNTLAAPNPQLTTKLSTAADGTTTGTVKITSGRHFTIAGNVRTSHGTVRTKFTQDIDFSNAQNFVSNPNTGNLAQNVRQNTRISTSTETTDGSKPAVTLKRQQWPLSVNINFVANSDGTYTQATTIDQELQRQELRSQNGVPIFFSVLSDVVTPGDTLFISPSGSITGNADQSSSEQYYAADSTGACYSRSITSTNGALDSVRNQGKCGHK